MTNLMIVESPTKARKIRGYLGGDWEVVASMGHIRALIVRPPQGSIGVDPPNFHPVFEVIDGKEERVRQLARMAKQADTVWLATDPDREGEAIAWHLFEVLGLKHAHRITFNKISKEAILESIANPRVIDANQVEAQKARVALDRVVGYLVSPRLGDLAGQRGLSAGRVQTPALRLIVDLETLIENFKPETHYGVRAHFKTGEVEWVADWDASKLLPPGEKYYKDLAGAQEVAKARDFLIEAVEKKQSKRAAPPGFTTSTMQQAAFRRFKMTTDEVMRVAQKLFENGYITYHRTDDPNISPEGYAELRRYAEKAGFKEYLAPAANTWKAKGNAQEAHECIRPIDFNKESASGLGTAEAKLYRLIWERTLASQMRPAEYDVTTVHLRTKEPVLGAPQPFLARGRVLTFAGWLQVAGDDAAAGEPDLPPLKAETALRSEKTEVQHKKTSPPSRLDEASLVKMLEAKGIGRPSTYATIISTLKYRKYVEVDKDHKFRPTTLGRSVIEALVGRFQFANINYTAQVEEALDRVAGGTFSYLDLVKRVYAQVTQEIKSLSGVKIEGAQGVKKGPPCPKCKGETVERKGRFGAFFGCLDRECDGLIDPRQEAREKALKKMGRLPGDGESCPQCQKGTLRTRPILKGKAKGKSFLGCDNYPECKYSSWPEEKVEPLAGDGEVCKKCQDGKMVTKVVRKGKAQGKRFLSCSAYPECDNAVWPDEGRRRGAG